MDVMEVDNIDVNGNEEEPQAVAGRMPFKDRTASAQYDQWMATEDHLITAFKPENAVPGVRQRLADQRLAEEIEALDLEEDEPDAEQDVENGYISDDGSLEY